MNESQIINRIKKRRKQESFGPTPRTQSHQLDEKSTAPSAPSETIQTTSEGPALEAPVVESAPSTLTDIEGLHEEFVKFLAELIESHPDQMDLILQIAISSGDFPEVQEDTRWKSRIKKMVKERRPPEFTVAILESLVKSMDLRSPTARLTQAMPSAPTLLNDIIAGDEFDLSQLEPNTPYEFHFIGETEVGRVQFTPRVLKFMISHRYNSNWISLFLKGLVPPQGRDGLKSYNGHDEWQYEIKRRGNGHDRIGVHFDKKTRLWTFVREFE